MISHIAGAVSYWKQDVFTHVILVTQLLIEVGSRRAPVRAMKRESPPALVTDRVANASPRCH